MEKIFQLHASAVLPKGEQPSLATHLIGAWVSLSAGIYAVAPLLLQKIKILVLQLTTSCCYTLVTYFGRGTRSESKLVLRNPE
jgi:hypothetical protein